MPNRRTGKNIRYQMDDAGLSALSVLSGCGDQETHNHKPSSEDIRSDLPLGISTLTLMVSDRRGGSISDDVTVTVKDTTVPQITLAKQPITLWPPLNDQQSCN